VALVPSLCLDDMLAQLIEVACMEVSCLASQVRPLNS